MKYQMNKKLKNRVFVLILLALLSLPVSVWAVDSADLNVNVNPQAITNTIDEDIDVAANKVSPVTEYKQPISKRKIVKKFLAAMGGVALSSFLLFFLLSVYNRIREGYSAPVKTPEGETSLETPDDLESAVKTFLDKTKWNE